MWLSSSPDGRGIGGAWGLRRDQWRSFTCRTLKPPFQPCLASVCLGSGLLLFFIDYLFICISYSFPFSVRGYLFFALFFHRWRVCIPSPSPYFYKFWLWFTVGPPPPASPPPLLVQQQQSAFNEGAGMTEWMRLDTCQRTRSRAFPRSEAASVCFHAV